MNNDMFDELLFQKEVDDLHRGYLWDKITIDLRQNHGAYRF